MPSASPTYTLSSFSQYPRICPHGIPLSLVRRPRPRGTVEHLHIDDRTWNGGRYRTRHHSKAPRLMCQVRHCILGWYHAIRHDSATGGPRGRTIGQAPGRKVRRLLCMRRASRCRTTRRTPVAGVPGVLPRPDVDQNTKKTALHDADGLLTGVLGQEGKILAVGDQRRRHQEHEGCPAAPVTETRSVP